MLGSSQVREREGKRKRIGRLASKINRMTGGWGEEMDKQIHRDYADWQRQRLRKTDSVCVCVCERERERQTDRQTEREKEIQRGGEESAI